MHGHSRHSTHLSISPWFGMAACLQGQERHAGLQYGDAHRPGLTDALLRWTGAPWRCYAINEKNMWRWGRTHFPADDILKPSRLSWIEAGIKSFSPSPAWTDGGSVPAEVKRRVYVGVRCQRARVFLTARIFHEELHRRVKPKRLLLCCVVVRQALPMWNCVFCLSLFSLPYLKPGQSSHLSNVIWFGRGNHVGLRN